MPRLRFIAGLGKGPGNSPRPGLVLRRHRTVALDQGVVEHDFLDLRLKGEDHRAQAVGVPDRRDEIAALAWLDSVVSGPAARGSTGSHWPACRRPAAETLRRARGLSSETGEVGERLLGLGLLRRLSHRAEPFLQLGGLFFGGQQAVELGLNAARRADSRSWARASSRSAAASARRGRPAAVRPAPIASAFRRIDSSTSSGGLASAAWPMVWASSRLFLGRGHLELLEHVRQRGDFVGQLALTARRVAVRRRPDPSAFDSACRSRAWPSSRSALAIAWARSVAAPAGRPVLAP